MGLNLTFPKGVMKHTKTNLEIFRALVAYSMNHTKCQNCLNIQFLFFRFYRSEFNFYVLMIVFFKIGWLKRKKCSRKKNSKNYKLFLLNKVAFNFKLALLNYIDIKADKNLKIILLNLDFTINNHLHVHEISSKLLFCVFNHCDWKNPNSYHSI